MNNLKKTLPLNTLQILDVIDKKGSFQAASQYFNRSISSLSYQVQKLEDELDLLLLDRSGHRAKFTEIGKILLENGAHY
ncbi:transcriptional regulator LysR family [Vibrio maritimus]|uniref:Transcriptional regulator LysR family n=1 Tax=Vibrio maritimus TaxID=990268 RepID=A0A090TBZ6_9VIBR|nr:transcriptional regulator LysR family [Vibrio maritimus]